eukprot:6186675-Pleurochrysis_carterae.AAC.2
MLRWPQRKRNPRLWQLATSRHWAYTKRTCITRYGHPRACSKLRWLERKRGKRSDRLKAGQYTGPG